LSRQRKGTKRKATPDGAKHVLRFSALGPSPIHSTSLCCELGADILSAPLTGSPQRSAMLGHAPYGDPTEDTARLQAWRVFAVRSPVEQAEHRNRFRRNSLDRVRARSALLLRARRVGRASGSGEERRAPALIVRGRSDRGGLSSGDSSLAGQRRVTCRGSTTHKLRFIYRLPAPKARTTILGKRGEEEAEEETNVSRHRATNLIQYATAAAPTFPA